MSGLNITFLVLGCCASLTAIIVAVIGLFRALRRRWVADAAMITAIEENTAAVQKLTNRVDDLDNWRREFSRQPSPGASPPQKLADGQVVARSPGVA